MSIAVRKKPDWAENIAYGIVMKTSDRVDWPQIDAIAAALRASRNEVIEECARVAETARHTASMCSGSIVKGKHLHHSLDFYDGGAMHADEIAAAIRSLKEPDASL